mgnify:CR=1 FL=1
MSKNADRVIAEFGKTLKVHKNWCGSLGKDYMDFHIEPTLPLKDIKDMKSFVIESNHFLRVLTVRKCVGKVLAFDITEYDKHAFILTISPTQEDLDAYLEERRVDNLKYQDQRILKLRNNLKKAQDALEEEGVDWRAYT